MVKESWEISNIRKQLLSMADDGYRSFHLKLVPGLERPVIGVRLPALRKIAKEISKGEPEEIAAFLTNADGYYEEIMLMGLVIGWSFLQFLLHL